VALKPSIACGFVADPIKITTSPITDFLARFFARSEREALKPTGVRIKSIRPITSALDGSQFLGFKSATGNIWDLSRESRVFVIEPLCSCAVLNHRKLDFW
jgi:hypothetical protein